VMVAVLRLYFVMCAFDDNDNQVFKVVSQVFLYIINYMHLKHT